MAHGLPDYYRGVDIAYQALSEMIVRPKYGGAMSLGGQAAVTPLPAKILCSVVGRGILYGGYVYADHTATQKDSKVILSIDGEALFATSFEDLCKYKLVLPRSALCHLLKYDDTAFIYAVGLPPDITFETDLTLVYAEGNGETLGVDYFMFYALIT